MEEEGDCTIDPEKMQTIINSFHRLYNKHGPNSGMCHACFAALISNYFRYVCERVVSGDDDEGTDTIGNPQGHC